MKFNPIPHELEKEGKNKEALLGEKNNLSSSFVLDVATHVLEFFLIQWK